MKLSDLMVKEKNINVDEYLDFINYVKEGMAHPEWLGDFSKEDIMHILSHDANIWMFYNGDDIACTMMIIPSSKKDLEKFNIDKDPSEVVDYGQMAVNPKYVGNGLQYQMLLELDNYAISKGYKYAASTVHPDNVYSINNIIKDKFEYNGFREFTRGPRNIYLKKL